MQNYLACKEIELSRPRWKMHSDSLFLHYLLAVCQSTETEKNKIDDCLALYARLFLQKHSVSAELIAI